MTFEQLHLARAARWRWDGRPLLTVDETRDWFGQHPLCLFLPQPKTIQAPAPSFVQAVRGEGISSAPPAAIEDAKLLLRPLLASGIVIPLNLMGGVQIQGGSQPDFLVHIEALPWVVSLRGDRNWKQPPPVSGVGEVSPLVSAVWKLLEGEGPKTVSEIRDTLGRELSEPAVLHALGVLWRSLRAVPVLGEPDRWELLQHHHRQALAAGCATSQVTAISLMVSGYLGSAIAATGEEIETFLSPLVSRSRIHEAIRGLETTRQIELVPIESQTHYFLAGAAAEFTAEQDVAAADVRAAMPQPQAIPQLPAMPQSPALPKLRHDPVSARHATGRKEGGKPSYERKALRRTGERRPVTGSKPAKQTGWRRHLQLPDKEEARPESGRRPVRQSGWNRPAEDGSKPWEKKDRRGPGSQRREFGNQFRDAGAGKRQSAGAKDRRYERPDRGGKRRPDDFGKDRKFQSSASRRPAGRSGFSPPRFQRDESSAKWRDRTPASDRPSQGQEDAGRRRPFPYRGAAPGKKGSGFADRLAWKKAEGSKSKQRGNWSRPQTSSQRSTSQRWRAEEQEPDRKQRNERESEKDSRRPGWRPAGKRSFSSGGRPSKQRGGKPRGKERKERPSGRPRG